MRRVLAGVAMALGCVASASGGLSSVPHWKTWLCYPGTANDWCSVVLTTTVVSANGSKRDVPVSVASNPKIDCFYVYPTVSLEYRGNADLRLQPEERETAITQAARFSHVCRVYAPLYRQTTGRAGGSSALAYSDVLAAWRDYLAYDNHGRGVVLLGHSQGAFMLTELIQKEIEDVPAERRLRVSAILLGGNIVVAKGKTTGGSFSHVPACTSATETGCVVAYSSYKSTPPADGFGVDARPGQQALCVNPAAPGSSRAVPITPIFAGINPQGIVPPLSWYVAYHWVEFPGLYTARCVDPWQPLVAARHADPPPRRHTAHSDERARRVGRAARGRREHHAREPRLARRVAGAGLHPAPLAADVLDSGLGIRLEVVPVVHRAVAEHHDRPIADVEAARVRQPSRGLYLRAGHRRHACDVDVAVDRRVGGREPRVDSELLAWRRRVRVFRHAHLSRLRQGRGEAARRGARPRGRRRDAGDVSALHGDALARQERRDLVG